MNLHRAVKSDWSNLPPQERNIWQRLAAASKGVVTPGNFISFVGAFIVLIGLGYLSHNQIEKGILYVLIGRVFDILDGYIAELTKTKSPIGEGVDATLDKILAFLSLIVIIEAKLIPLFIAYAMLAHAIYVSSISIVARRHRTYIHPSRSGKFSTAFEWFSIGFYLFKDVLTMHHSGYTTLIGVAGLLCFIIFVGCALWSMYNYTRNVYYKQAIGT